MSNWLGRTIGKVRVDRLVARGGMAEVYLGTHITLDRPVAIKVLLSHLEGEPDLQERFQREARVLASLRHSNIVQIFDYDVVEGQPFIVMEYIAGPSLSTYLREMHRLGGELTLPQIGRLLVMLAAALDYAHSLGVIHRDVKPANILLHTRGGETEAGMPPIEKVEPILTDFGLLRLVDSASKSTTGTVAGTPTYMSPEQAMGAHVDGRSDLYSFGIVIYELLSGRVPFDADTTMGILMKHIQEPPPPLPNLPPHLQTVMEKILAKRPEERYETAREFASAFLAASNLTIDDVVPGASITHRRSKPVIPPVEHADARPTLVSKPAVTPVPMTPAKKKNVLPMIAMITALCVVVLGASFFAFKAARSFFGGGSAPTAIGSDNNPSTPETSSTTTAPVLTTYGLVRFHDLTARLDEVTVSTDKMSPPPEGFQYQAWLIGGEEQLPLGYLVFDANGNAQLTYSDLKGRNLAGLYDHFEITQEPNPDPSPLPSDQVVYSSGLPPKALEHLRHLIYAFDSTPDKKPYVFGLLTAAQLIDAQAEALLAASQAGNAVEVKKSAEAIYNIIVGNQGDQYGDLDGDKTITDPSDGYGLLLNGSNSGYIEGAIHHSTVAAEKDDATANIHHHAPHVSDPAKNIDEWSIELRDLVLKIVADPQGPQAAENIRQAVSLANRILHGQDLDGNEKVDPILGEGGAETIHEHAEYMLDMPILKGVDQLPPPAPASTEMPGMNTGGATSTPGGSEPPGYGP